MGRILVLLTFTGLIAAFVIIYNSTNKPVQSAAVSNSNVPARGNTKSTKQSEPDKKGRATVTGRAAARRSKVPSKAVANGTEATEATGAEAPDSGPGDAGGDPLQTVKGDSTPVYSANSKHSKVLRRLKRGEKVPPDLEIIDSEGRWRVVKGKGKERPGFVREEQIERRPPTEASSAKNKPGRELTKQ